MADAYQVAHLDELDSFPAGAGGLTWRPVRRRFGIEAFGLNLACYEAQAGDTEDALDALGKAIELSGDARRAARGDSDFDAMRDDPRFQELVAE